MLELTLHSSKIQIFLTNGFISKIVQVIEEGYEVIDDKWSTHSRYQNREPFWYIDQLRSLGWKLKSN